MMAAHQNDQDVTLICKQSDLDAVNDALTEAEYLYSATAGVFEFLHTSISLGYIDPEKDVQSLMDVLTIGHRAMKGAAASDGAILSRFVSHNSNTFRKALQDAQ